MEPDKNFEAAPEFPQPEVDPIPSGSEYRPATKPEMQHGPSQTQPVSGGGTGPVLPGSAFTPPAPIPSSTTAIGSHTDDLIADDSDLIEKEWVMKAKAIVAHTKDDPYRQNEEMTKVKADYLKKRYNKDLKANEG